LKNHTETLDNLYKALQTNPETGLMEQQVVEIRDVKGLNRFEEGKKETVLQKVLHHLKDFTSIILLIAAAISFVLALTEGHGFADPIVILAIVVVDTILAVLQEIDAEKALEALKKMNAHMTVVIRGGVKQSIDASELVPGDILVMESGDMIPADARIIDSMNLKVEESVLTGESVPVDKDANAVVAEKAPLGDRLNMLFSGCLITSGRVLALVVETGMNTEMGKIAGLLNNTKKIKTPLQKRMAKLGKVLSFVAIGSAAVLFILQYFVHGERILEVLMNAVALAVAVVPETLPVIVTITLAFGVRVMAKKNAIIRKIPAVETLGSASVICSDKTGTLTMNRMTIKRIWTVPHGTAKAEDTFNHTEMNLIKMMGLASNASIGMHDGELKEIGDPTETAIIRLLRDKYVEKEELDAMYPKIFEIPFDSERKLMTTVHELDGLDEVGYISITKGAFDRIPLGEKSSACVGIAQRVHDQFAASALRVLAVAFKGMKPCPKRLTRTNWRMGLNWPDL